MQATPVALDGSPTPPFEQIRRQVADAITGGHLRRGTRLPTVRQLASDLDLAPNTVARAYRALEGAGLVEGRGRRGTFVIHAPGPRRAPEHTLLVAAARYHGEARRLGASTDAAVSALRRVAAGLVATPADLP